MNIFKKSIALLVAAVVVVTMCGKDVAYAATFSVSDTMEVEGRIITCNNSATYERATASTTYTNGSGYTHTSIKTVQYYKAIPIEANDIDVSKSGDRVSTPGTAYVTLNATTGYAMKETFSTHTYYFTVGNQTHSGFLEDLHLILE